MNVIVKNSATKEQTTLSKTLVRMQNFMAKFVTSEERNLLSTALNYNSKNCDVATLYILMTKFGFTVAQLNQFWDEYVAHFGYMGESREFLLSDIPEAEELRAAGFNIDDKFVEEEYF